MTDTLPALLGRPLDPLSCSGLPDPVSLLVPIPLTLSPETKKCFLLVFYPLFTSATLGIILSSFTYHETRRDIVVSSICRGSSLRRGAKKVRYIILHTQLRGSDMKQTNITKKKTR